MAKKSTGTPPPAKSNRDEFKASIRHKLAERAGYICSKPDCRRLTVGPSFGNPNISVKSGRAAHICAASEGGPRYDANQSVAARTSISNGIWLCSICSDIIDKDVETVFDVQTLRQWKAKHERLVDTLRLRPQSILGQVRKGSEETEIAQQVVTFLDDKGALFEDIQYEVQERVIPSLIYIRKELPQFQNQLSTDSDLYQLIGRIRAACQSYMKSTTSSDPSAMIEAELAVMRKHIGMILQRFKDKYGVRIGSRLSEILPQ